LTGNRREVEWSDVDSNHGSPACDSVQHGKRSVTPWHGRLLQAGPSRPETSAPRSERTYRPYATRG